MMQASRADLLTVWPTQVTETWAERLVVPLMALVVGAYLPILFTHHTPWTAFAAANGQRLAVRRPSYDSLGGHERVRGEIVEDIRFARLTKRAGLRLRMAEGNGLVSCRMYDGWPQVRDGYAKNILAGYGNHVWALLLATAFHWLIFLMPLGWLLWALISGGPILTPLLLVALGLLVRAITAYSSRQRPQDALLMPVSVLLMTMIAGTSPVVALVTRRADLERTCTRPWLRPRLSSALASAAWQRRSALLLAATR